MAKAYIYSMKNNSDVSFGPGDAVYIARKDDPLATLPGLIFGLDEFDYYTVIVNGKMLDAYEFCISERRKV